MNIVKPAKTLLGMALVSACSMQAAAEDEKKSIEAEAELGAIFTSGNTETTSIKGKLDLKQDFKHWRTHYILESFFKKDEVEVTENGTTSEEKQTTAEKYFVSAQGDYKLHNDHAALFIYGSYSDDRFSGFDYQATIAVGYSDLLFKTDNSKFTYNVGPGAAFNKTNDGDDSSTFIIRVAADYVYQISENAKFTQTLTSDIAPDTDETTKTKSVTAISANLNSALALKASYTIDYNSQVPEGNEHADTQTALTVVYSF